MGADDRETIVPRAAGVVEPYFDITHLVTPETRQRRIDELRAEGYRKAIADLRNVFTATFDRAADFLESRLTKEQP